MRLTFTPIAVALLMAGTSTTTPAAGQGLRVGGTGTATGMLEQIAPGFTAATGAWLVVVPSLGSSGSIRAVVEKKIDIAVAGRALRPTEAASGLIQLAVFRTAFVIATSHRKPSGLKKEDLAGIYKAPNPAWPDGTPVRIVLRPRSDSDTELLTKYFPGMGDALEAAYRRPELPTGATDQDNADLAERLRGSLAATTTSQIKTERRHLEVLAIDGVEPTLANVENGTYPYTKALHFIARAADGADVVRLIEFLRSPEGLKLLREAEVLPETP